MGVPYLLSGHEQCPDKHTPQTPEKDRARSWWMNSSHRGAPLLTISPGALGALRWTGWTGPVWISDICRPCIKSANRLIKHYPELLLKRAINKDIQTVTRLLIPEFDCYKVDPIIDMDLASVLHNAIDPLRSVLTTLIKNKIHAKVLLTYVRRSGASNAERTRYLKRHLPRGAEYVDSYNYVSGWSNEHHRFSKGSNMTIADIRT